MFFIRMVQIFMKPLTKYATTKELSETCAHVFKENLVLKKCISDVDKTKTEPGWIRFHDTLFHMCA